MLFDPVEANNLLDVAGAAAYLGVSVAFVRRLVLERRVRYFKVGKFVRFRPVDLDAFVAAGRHEPVKPRVDHRSTPQRPGGRNGAQHRTGVRPQSNPTRRQHPGDA
jgi:excisionase family DNA binding protein